MFGSTRRARVELRRTQVELAAAPPQPLPLQPPPPPLCRCVESDAGQFLVALLAPRDRLRVRTLSMTLRRCIEAVDDQDDAGMAGQRRRLRAAECELYIVFDAVDPRWTPPSTVPMSVRDMVHRCERNELTQSRGSARGRADRGHGGAVVIALPPLTPAGRSCAISMCCERRGRQTGSGTGDPGWRPANAEWRPGSGGFLALSRLSRAQLHAKMESRNGLLRADDLDVVLAQRGDGQFALTIRAPGQTAQAAAVFPNVDGGVAEHGCFALPGRTLHTLRHPWDLNSVYRVAIEHCTRCGISVHIDGKVHYFPSSAVLPTEPLVSLCLLTYSAPAVIRWSELCVRTGGLA